VPKAKKRKEAKPKGTPKAKQEQQLQRITTYTGIAALVVVVGIVGFYLLAGRSPEGGPPPVVDLEKVDFKLEEQPSLGDPEAPVKIMEFADFKCPACKTFHERVFPRLREEYIETGLVEFFFINFQFLAEDSVTAGIAGECLYQQSEQAFWQYYDAIFANQGPEPQRWATRSFLLQLVRQHVSGIDEEEFQSCLAEGRTRPDVEEDKKIGQSAGVSATPTVLINKRKFEGAGPYSRIKAIIERELERSE
jgi:protein-disulfide isomerase